MARYIDIEPFTKWLKGVISSLGQPHMLKQLYLFGVKQALLKVFKMILIIPTADVEEVKHGEWIVDGDITECSNCHKEYVTARGMLQLKEFDYCPKCGAKMDRQ